MARYLVVGDGIAAKAIIFTLSQKLNKNDVIIQLAQNDFINPCSLATTSIASLRGTRAGVSKLGDQIRSSHVHFEKFVQKYKPRGVTLSEEIQLWPDNETAHTYWNRRYPTFFAAQNIPFCHFSLDKYVWQRVDAYIIAPNIFYDWLKENSRFEFYSEYVTSISGTEVNCLSGKKYSADIVYLCVGHNSSMFNSLITEDKMEVVKTVQKVAGSFWVFDGKKLSEDYFDKTKSFSLALEKHHLIYRHESQECIIGSTARSGSSIEIPETQKLTKIYAHFCDVFGAEKLLPIESAVPLCGIRSKGVRRLPYWGEISPNVYGVWNLYKNAFTYAFEAANTIIK